MLLENKVPSIITVILLLAFLAGCQDRNLTKHLWPDLHDPYVRVVNEWTRKGAIHSGLDTELIAYATLKSPEWMDAYVQKKAADFDLSSEEREQLYQDHQKSLERETEIFLALAKGAGTRRERLRFDDPMWSVYLQHGDEKIYPLEIREVRDPLARLQAYYPYVNRWQDHYVLRFPPVQEKPLDLIMTGPLGRIRLGW